MPVCDAPHPPPFHHSNLPCGPSAAEPDSRDDGDRAYDTYVDNCIEEGRDWR